MKITANGLILLSYLMLTTFCSVTLEDEKQLSITDKFHETEKVGTGARRDVCVLCIMLRADRNVYMWSSGI